MRFSPREKSVAPILSPGRARHQADYPERPMRLVIVRHAEAGPGTPDELRTLTPAGREQACELGRRLRDEGVAPDAVLSSPLLRARETAVVLALGTPEVDERLAPGATPEAIREAVL